MIPAIPETEQSRRTTMSGCQQGARCYLCHLQTDQAFHTLESRYVALAVPGDLRADQYESDYPAMILSFKMTRLASTQCTVTAPGCVKHHGVLKPIVSDRDVRSQVFTASLKESDVSRC